MRNVIYNRPMARVRFTRHLKRFFPDLDQLEIDAPTVADLLVALDLQHEGLRDYVVDDAGRLRKHVNVFVDGTLVSDRVSLSDIIDANSEVFIMQALSGG